MKEKKVVLDTNIIVSSLWGGKPGHILELWNQGKFKLVISAPVLNEYLEVISRFDVTEEDIDEFLILFLHSIRTVLVEPKKKINIIKADVNDNRFLEAAVAGKADFIVSGDKHLLALDEYKGIKIVSASDFLRAI